MIWYCTVKVHQTTDSKCYCLKIVLWVQYVYLHSKPASSLLGWPPPPHLFCWKRGSPREEGGNVNQQGPHDFFFFFQKCGGGGRRFLASIHVCMACPPIWCYSANGQLILCRTVHGRTFCHPVTGISKSSICFKAFRLRFWWLFHVWTNKKPRRDRDILWWLRPIAHPSLPVVPPGWVLGSRELFRYGSGCFFLREDTCDAIMQTSCPSNMQGLCTVNTWLATVYPGIMSKVRRRSMLWGA